MNALKGYENSGHLTTHAVKVDLTDDEILRYGQQLAQNVRQLIPDQKQRFEEAAEPLEEKLRLLRQEYEYLIAQLALVPGDDGYVNERPEAESAKELARVLSEIKGVESQLRSLKLENRVALNKIELDNELLEMRINLQYEMRDVTCSWWVNWSAGHKKLVRVDTKEIVLEKPLSPEERQLSLLDLDITEDMLAEANA